MPTAPEILKASRTESGVIIVFMSVNSELGSHLNNQHLALGKMD
jgi:hypothetical protein